ncbi:MAG TPA: cobalamin-dependent protein [Acidimicrobiia bacterium]|jgi:methanogenic corrinoid protein MtbC1|nr:cobalamin-dependent protein [Acidimicrobiia bacterium]
MSSLPTDDLRTSRLAVLAAVMESDAGLAFDIVSGLMAEGVSFESVLFAIVAPLQTEMGRRWQQGDVGISEEHASTGAVETLVALLAGSLSQPDDGDHVVVACAEGDNHSLPARMIAAYLLYLGYRVTFLGTSVPASDLGGYLEEMKPQAVVLSCAMATNLPGARRSIQAAHESGVPVLAGGRGFGDGSRATLIGADAWAATPQELAALLGSWQPRPDLAEAAAQGQNEESAQLEVDAPRVFADARDNATMILGDAVRGRVAADMWVMVKALVASVMTDDAEIMREYAAWHSQMRAATHGSAETTPIILSALHDAVAERSPTAAAHLDHAIATLD